MERMNELISTAGNTEAPAYLTILSKGYSIKSTEISHESIYIATKNLIEFRSDSMTGVLGLISIREIRGENWKASDSEINEFMKIFYPNSNNE